MATVSREDMVAQGYVDISGTWYKKVSARLAQFREANPTHSISTSLEYTEKTVRAETEIRDPDGRLIANGHSEKRWRNGEAGRSVGVERAETGAVGRALAFFGLPGDDLGIGSADEIVDAVEDRTQELEGALSRILAHIAAVDRCWDSVVEIRSALANERWEDFVLAYDELDNQDKVDLWLAPSKGGIFSTEERKLIKEGPGVREARQALKGEEK